MSRAFPVSPGRTRLALLAVAIIAASCPAVPAAEPAAVSVFPLAAAPELKKAVTLTETKIPLSELVQKVAAETGARLAALPGVADEPVAVVVKELPARELLEQVAELLDYRWSRRGRAGAWRYELHQDRAAKGREEACRKVAGANVELRLQQEIKALTELLEQPPEVLEKILEEGEAAERKLQELSPQQFQAARRSPERLERTQQMRHALLLASPIRRALVTLLSRLTPPQWAALSADGTLQFATEPQVGELPLPADLSQVLRTAQPEIYPANRLAYPDNPRAEEELRADEKRMQERWLGASGYRVTIRLRANAYQHPTGGSLELNVEAAPIRTGLIAAAAPFGQHPHLTLSAGPDDPQPAVVNGGRRAAALAKDPVLGARRRFQPDAKLPSDAVPGYRSRTRLQTLLPDLARSYGVNLIADAYWNAPALSPDSFRSTNPVPLYSLLDRLAGDTHQWERHGKLIRLRSQSWFFDRPREAPLRHVRRWRAIFAERGVMPVEEYVRMATALTDEQLEGLAVMVAREEGLWPGDLGVVHRARHALRLYGSLGTGQRQALWEGRTVPFGEMLPPQQAQFLAAVRELSRFGPAPPDPRLWTEAGFALAAQPFVRIRERQGERVIERSERAAPPGQEPGQRARPARRSRPLGVTETLFPLAKGPRHEPAAAPDRAAAGEPVVTRHPFLSLRFQFRLGGAQQPSTHVYVAPPS